MKIIVALLVFVLPFAVSAQNREKAFEINEKLGRGINYGNMFEAPSETAWGNPWKPQYAGMIAELGFNHVRIPIRWEPSARSSATPPYTINPVFFTRIKQVVDSALNNGLYAIINMHHHEALYENPEGQKERFLAQWKQISGFFAEYPDSLLFEILNEPHGNLSAGKWNTFLADALTTIRQDNPERIVLIGTAEYGGVGGLSQLQIPDDDNVIVTVHYYNPFNFTHQGAEWSGEQAQEWLGTEWTDTETERQVMQNEFAPLVAFSRQHNLPVHIGEFGAYSKADMASRVKWTTYLARYLETLNWSWAYWEFSAGFGIYDPSTGKYRQELVDALLHNKMPEPARYVGTPVYQSNFSQTVSDWSLYTNGGASASHQKLDNTLKIDITRKGSAGWHIQLVKSNVKLQAGKKYRLTFKAKAATRRDATSYVGMSTDPWSAYSGYNGISLADTFAVYTFIFDMKSTDNSARIVFDFGTDDTDVTIEYITLEEIVLTQPTSSVVKDRVKTSVYPNPASRQITIDNRDGFTGYSIVNVFGGTGLSGRLNGFRNSVPLDELAPGMYVLRLEGENLSHSVKFLKE